jgi:hypothetical protein
MLRRLKRKFFAGIAVAAVLAGLTAAVVMAAQPAHRHAHAAARHHAAAQRRDATLASAAAYLGSTPAELRSELQSGKSLAQIAAAAAGKSEAGLIQALEAAQQQKLSKVAATLSARVKAEVDRVGDRARGHARGSARQLSAAATYLGIGNVQLRTDLRSGKTLAQITAATAGKTQAGLVEALVAADKTNIQARVAAGAITQAHADQVLSTLTSRVSTRIDRVYHREHAHAGPHTPGG